MAGATDRAAPPQAQRELAVWIRGSRFETVPDVGHDLAAERPGELVEAVRRVAAQDRQPVDERRRWTPGIGEDLEPEGVEGPDPNGPSLDRKGRERRREPFRELLGGPLVEGDRGDLVGAGGA